VIAVPGGGLATTSSIVFGSFLAAQVEVTAGPVNISKITVDGTATSTTCPSDYYVGIFYREGSSGTVNRVETRYQNCNDSGTGILAENGAGATQSVTLENNDVHDNTYAGIYACSNQTPSTLTAYIKNNYVGNSGQWGIATDCNVAGSVSDNLVAGGFVGISAGSPSSPVSGNTVNGGTYGIYLPGAAKVSGNTINVIHFGIFLDAAGTVLSNRIANSE
jgi:parallel beta-helix repeat protein